MGKYLIENNSRIFSDEMIMKGNNHPLPALLALFAFVNLFLGIIPSEVFILVILLVQLYVLNRYESAFIFSLFASTIGTFFAMKGFRGVGTLFMIISFLIIFLDYNRLFKKFITAIVPLLIIFIFLIFSSFFSDGGDYSKEKVISTILSGVMMAFTYAYFFHYNYKFNTYYLSLFTLIYVLFAFKYTIDYLGSNISLSNLFDFEYFRTLVSVKHTDDFKISINYQTLGFMGLLGLSFTLFDNFSKSINYSVLFIYLLSCFVITYSGSRQAILTLVVITVFVILRRKRRKLNFRKYIYFILFVSIMAYLFLESNVWYIKDLRKGSDIIEAAGRMELIDAGLRQFSQNKLLGVGYGRYINPDGVYGGSPHNIFVELLAETGIFGLFTIFFLLTIYVVRNYKFFNLFSDWMFGIFCIIITHFIRSLVSADFSYNIVLFSLVFMIPLYKPKILATT